MNKGPDPEDVDVFVRAAELDPAAALEIERIIEEYKKRPEYVLEAAEAERILGALGLHAPDYGIPDARSLLERWHNCRAELRNHDSRNTSGTVPDQADLPDDSGCFTEKPRGDATSSNPV